MRAAVPYQLAALLLYSGALILFALWVSKRGRGTKSFFVADRKLSPALVFSTFLAANIGAGSIIVASALAYNVGVSGWWFVGSAGIGQLIFAFFVGPRIWKVARDHDLYTAGDYLELRYGSSVRATVVSILWLGTLAILATQLIAMSEIFEWVLGVPRGFGAALGGLVMIIYFSAGGLFTSAWVNMVQLGVLLVGLILAVGIGLSSAGGLEAALAAVPPDGDFLNPFALGGIVMFALVMPSFVVSPGHIQKGFGARDASTLRMAVGLQAVVLLIFAFVPMSLGVLAHSFNPALENADFAVQTVLTAGLPPVLGALGLAAVFSAEVSSADAVLFMLSTSMSKDIYKRYMRPEASEEDVLRVARIAAIVGGAGGIALTLLLESVLDSISIFYAILSVSLFVPLVAGLYSKRPGVPEALAAIGCGVTALCSVSLAERLEVWATPAWMNATGIGIAVSAVVFGIVFLVRRPSRSPHPMAEYPLEPTAEEMRSMLAAVSERVVEHIESLPDQPASYTADGREAARAFAESVPDQGTPLEELLSLVFDEATPISFNTAGPGYLAYIPGGGIFPAALADLIANAINRYVGVWVAAPALVQLELNVIRWFAELMGYGDGSGGVLTSGGSLSNLTAIVTARRERFPDDFHHGVLYTSDQTHHSIRKSAVLAGFPESAVREVPSNDRQEIEAGPLLEQIRRDRESGLVPFLVAGSAGTTNTGAVDPLDELADVAKQENLWFHVDGAYGAFFMLTERGRAAMSGIERADSITLDPHKGLFLPYGTGCLLVRDEQALRRAHATFADYMPVMQHDADYVDFCDLSPELSRDFRGLRAWLPIKLFGMDAFRASLDEKLDLARFAAEQLRDIDEVTIVCEPRLSLVAFRLHREGLDGAQLDSLNRELLERINAKQNVYLTGTVVDGRFAIRICVLSFRTHGDRIEQCIDDIREAITSLRGAP